MNKRIVIVDSGIGSVVASRLAEDKDYKILLVEDTIPKIAIRNILEVYDASYKEPTIHEDRYRNPPEEWRKKHKRWKSK